MSRPLFFVLALAAASPLAAQQRPADDSIPVMQNLELDGPRVGATWISGARAMARLHELDLQPFMSVIGWHFEQVTRPRAGGPSFVVQELMVVAGLDQGIAIPSGSLLFGIRLPSGFEFGVGPNVSPVGAGLAMGFGKSLRFGGVTIPLNIGVVHSKGALRTTLLAGYAIRRR
jgi:hypothetical protein